MKPKQMPLPTYQKSQRKLKNLLQRLELAYSRSDQNQIEHLSKVTLNSAYAAVVAVYQTHKKKGARTPGIDGVTWKTKGDLAQAIEILLEKSYTPQPGLRKYIPKDNGSMRSLNIPTLVDRAQQLKLNFVLTPFSESESDLHSYGFRPGYSCHHAIGRVSEILSQSTDLKYVLEADIKSFFDDINHAFLLNRLPAYFRRWVKPHLQAGFMDRGEFQITKTGTPQGGCLSSTLANITLNGLEPFIKALDASCEVVRYADDFIVFGKSQASLRKVQTALDSFFAERGLCLSADKTHLKPIWDGIDFLGVNLKRSTEALQINPSEKSIQRLQQKLMTLKNQEEESNSRLDSAHLLIKGWLNYHRGWFKIDSDVGKKVIGSIEDFYNSPAKVGCLTAQGLEH